ncbi:MAG: restriction endonuclease [Bacteroidetes bacterium SW_9_63_38]|nr:MAG: restriction endonuclease [Bacteroidetes bacterium SW_9_63_38]
MDELPPVPPVETIQERLRLIFPEGTPHRNYCVRDMAARTVFVMLYVGAIADEDRWVRPDQVTRMTDEQASNLDPDRRTEWREWSLRSKSKVGSIPGRWYSDNTRESIRDETIRDGLIPLGAIVEREGLPTTSPRPRYGLDRAFAALFDPDLTDPELTEAIEDWQDTHLSPGARARVKIMQRTTSAEDESVLVRFPSEQTRRMAPGPSSDISKAVVEEFAPRFLKEPRVVFLSESRNKVVARDESLAEDIGLDLEPDRRLPDLILVDVSTSDFLLVFVEVVATDGPVNRRRRESLPQYALDAGFDPEQVAFVTAYLDRDDSSFRKTVTVLAWNTFAWFMSEPEKIMVLKSGNEKSGTLARLTK